jgi:hypothetical protein
VRRITHVALDGRRIAPSGANHDDDLKCASGYVVAFDENGDPYCAPEGDQGRASGVGTATVGLPAVDRGTGPESRSQAGFKRFDNRSTSWRSPAASASSRARV